MKTERNANRRLMSMLASPSHALHSTTTEAAGMGTFSGVQYTLFKPPIPLIGEHDD